MAHFPEAFVDGRMATAFCSCGWIEEHSTIGAADRAASRHPAPVPAMCLTCGFEPPSEIFEQFERGEILTREDFDDRAAALHMDFDGAHYANWVEDDES